MKTLFWNPRTDPNTTVTLLGESQFGEATLQCPFCDYDAAVQWDTEPSKDRWDTRPANDEAVQIKVGRNLGEHIAANHKERVRFGRKTRRVYRQESPA